MDWHVEFDHEADALYVKLSDVPVDRTDEVDPFHAIDRAADGTVVGLELLCYSTQSRLIELAITAGVASSDLSNFVQAVANVAPLREYQGATYGHSPSVVSHSTQSIVRTVSSLGDFVVSV